MLILGPLYPDGGTVDGFGAALPDIRDVRGLPIEVLIGRDGAVIEARNANVYKKSWGRDLEARLVDALGLGTGDGS